MFSSDRFRQLISNAIRPARAIRNWYWDSGLTNAELRGISLLKEWLTPEQLTQYESYRYFDVIGGHSGTRYRIRYGSGMNVTKIGCRGKPEAGLCFLPSEALVAGDVMLAQKIALEADEWSALAVARRFSPSWL
jgi:hypothetical protein